MKLTKAKYNWLVAQYNYRKNKEQLIEISDEEYQRLTNNSGIIDDEIIDESIYFEKIIYSDHGSGNDVDIQDLPDNNNAYTVCGNELVIEKLHDVYVKYSNDTYKEITHQIKYHLDKNIGILKSTGVSSLTYYPPESIDEDTIDLQIIGECNGYVFNWTKIKLYSNLYPSQIPTIIGTWKGNMAQIEHYKFGIDETSYIESEITFLNNGKTYDGEIYNGIWTTYCNDGRTYSSDFNWNFNNGIIYIINFADGSSNCEITRYYLNENRFRGVFYDDFIDENHGYAFDLYKFNNSYQCNFIFDTSLHPLPCLLTNILDNPGHFCKITIQIHNGIKHLHITSNYDCAFEDIPLTTEIENQHNYTLGINNCIIVGKSSYDNILVAYDGCCPNCNKQLQWTNNSNQLYCDDCKLSYDVNNGVIINGNGKQLLKYQCDYNGTILRVRN